MKLYKSIYLSLVATSAFSASASANTPDLRDRDQLDAVRILKPVTAELMQQRLYPSDSRLSSALHGFYESNRDGQRTIITL